MQHLRYSIKRNKIEVLFMVREAQKEDLDALLKLYLFLHEDSVPEQSEHLEKTWRQITLQIQRKMVIASRMSRISFRKS